MKNKDILIVNYSFPPTPGIGGRRWALFAKELAKKGYTVHVLSKRYKKGEKSLYSDILNDKKIRLYSLPTFYPQVLDSSPSTFLEKTSYHFWLFLLSKLSKGSPYDKALFGKKKIQNKVIKIINQNNIKNVIVTGTPFRLCYYLAEIKHKIPNLIIDFRDPWTWGEGYGYKKLSKVKLSFEKKMELETIEKADIIFCPVEIMHSHLISAYPKYKQKIKVLPHGFDAENVMQHNGNRFKQKQKLKLIFIGTLYSNIEYQLKDLTTVLSNNNISLDIYSNSLRYKSIFDRLPNGKVNYYSPILPVQLFKKIKNYDFCLIIHPQFGKDSISTKLYELIYSQTPIIYIGYKGLTEVFIKEKNVGIYINNKNIIKDLTKDKLLNFNYSPKIAIKQYSYKNITKELITYFK